MGQALATGHVLRGKYRLEQVLGRGGMGTVHLATHVTIGQRVAIKIVNFSAGQSDKERIVARFLREARAASLLESEHVVRILDVDSTEDGDPFMVMEFLLGTDLGGLLKRSGRLDRGNAVAYVLQACEALAEAHAAGIVHRDLKPSNLFRTESVAGAPLIKLLDFGISKLAEPGDDLSLTETNAVVGSPLFMSPEQLLSSRDVDHRSDIWSLGVTLYQLLSGALPFEASTATGLGAQIVATAPRPLDEVDADLPPELAQAVMCCLARAKENRFDDIVSLARAIAPWTSGDPAAAVAAVERAMNRGVRGRPPVPSASPSLAAPVEASGERSKADEERWTRSVQGDPRLTASAVGPPTPPPISPVHVHVPVPVHEMTGSRSAESTAEPPVIKTRRLQRRVGIALVVLVVAAAIAFALTRRSSPQPIAGPAPPVSEPAPVPSAEPPAEPSASTSAASTATATPRPTRVPYVPGPRTRPRPAGSSNPGRPSWSKDPSELELK